MQKGNANISSGWKLSAFGNDYLLCRTITSICLQRLNQLNDIQAFQNLPKHNVPLIQPWCLKPNYYRLSIYQVTGPKLAQTQNWCVTSTLGISQFIFLWTTVIMQYKIFYPNFYVDTVRNNRSHLHCAYEELTPIGIGACIRHANNSWSSMSHWKVIYIAWLWVQWRNM